MTILLNNEEITSLIDMPACIDALEIAYKGLARGSGVTRRRSDIIVATQEPDRVYGLKSMDGVSPELGVGAVRINSDIISYPEIGGRKRRVKVPAAPGERYTGLVLLFSCVTGEPLAIMPDGVVQRMRVGATNGLATRLLARADTPQIAIIGSGWQAGAQLMAMAAVRDVRRVRCYSPNPDNRDRFCREMSESLDLAVEPAGAARDAVRGADVVLCATSSMAPILPPDWLEPGMHISSIKRPELDPSTIRRADRFFIHSRDAEPLTLMGAGVAPPDSGAGAKPALVDDFDFDSLPTLPDLVAGDAEGRQSDEEITCFVNNIGLGFQFAVVGAVVYRRAKEQGVGNDLPTEWFTEKEHP